jgi:hypothetical protein
MCEHQNVRERVKIRHKEAFDAVTLWWLLFDAAGMTKDIDAVQK